jgi:hypothetical protein
MNRRRSFLADLVLLALSVGAVYLVSHPDQLARMRPLAQQATIRALHASAAALGRAAIRVEHAYRVEVTP